MARRRSSPPPSPAPPCNAATPASGTAAARGSCRRARRLGLLLAHHEIARGALPFSTQSTSTASTSTFGRQRRSRHGRRRARCRAGELRGLIPAERLLDGLQIADAGIGALRVVGHVLEHHEPAAAGVEAASRSGLVGIHQGGHFQQPRSVVLGLVGRDVEFRIAREDILNAAGTADPGDAIGRAGGCAGAVVPSHQATSRRSARTPAYSRPTRPSPDSRRGRWRAEKGICTAHARSRSRRSACRSGSRRRSGPQRSASEAGLNAALHADRDPAPSRRPSRPALSQALSTASATSFDLRRPDPAIAHRHEAGSGAGMLQPDPVDHGHARKDAIEIVRVTLRHGQRLAPAFGRSHEIRLRRRLAVGAHRQRPCGVVHLLVGPVRKILERLVVERELLRRLAGLPARGRSRCRR